MIIRKSIVLLMVICFLSILFSQKVYCAGANNDECIAWGKDLSENQREYVLNVLEQSVSVEDCDEVIVTNEEEHKWLDKYLDKATIGSNALSTAYVSLNNDENQITVAMDNIEYCTEKMYQNALATAGVETAKILVVAPFKMSGTAALIGVMKAYEKMTGTQISDDRIDAAVNEFVVTSELIEKEKNYDAEELIYAIKERIKSKDTSDVETIVQQVVDEKNITLDDSEINKLVILMKKINQLEKDKDNSNNETEILYEKLDRSRFERKHEFGIDITKPRSLWEMIFIKL